VFCAYYTCTGVVARSLAGITASRVRLFRARPGLYSPDPLTYSKSVHAKWTDSVQLFPQSNYGPHRSRLDELVVNVYRMVHHRL
jgi:hypothetical protein